MPLHHIVDCRNAYRSLSLLMLMAILTGCPNGRGITWPTTIRPPVIPDDSSVEEIVQVLNINTLGTQVQPGLKSWHATNATVSVPGMVSVPATIAVEAPRNLRIRIAHPISRNELFDLGSNPEEFWVWARDAEPAGVVHVKHEQVEIISRYFDLPIHPDWMMEVFGVVALNPAEYRREESDAGRQYTDLVGQKLAPNGMRVTNVIRVDMRRGVIVRRSLHADDGTVLGLASFANHERDSQSQLMLPREIGLEIPMMDAAVTFNLKQVQLNPPAMAARYWEPPQIAGEPHVQMVDMLPPEALQASPQFAGQRQTYPPIAASPEDEGSVRLNDLRGAGGFGNSLQPHGRTEIADLPSGGGLSPSDPSTRWDDIGGQDFPPVDPSISSRPELMYGEDAPLWPGGSSFDNSREPPGHEPMEFLPTEPADVDSRPAWAQ